MYKCVCVCVLTKCVKMFPKLQRSVSIFSECYAFSREACPISQSFTHYFPLKARGVQQTDIVTFNGFKSCKKNNQKNVKDVKFAFKICNLQHNFYKKNVLTKASKYNSMCKLLNIEVLIIIISSLTLVDKVSYKLTQIQIFEIMNRKFVIPMNYIIILIFGYHIQEVMSNYCPLSYLLRSLH